MPAVIEKKDKVQLEVLTVKEGQGLFDTFLKIINKANDNAQLSYILVAFEKASARIVGIVDTLIKVERNKICV